ncbi:MAG: hypothetical protein PWQ55_1880 [Chloroflexota bacterium]|nr:hypothetical protein [Chloroflexota bacterium]
MDQRPKFNLQALYLSICNLNFLGIGYLLAGKRKRWLIALGGNLALLAGAYFLNASRQPVLWAVLYIAAYLAMAVDLYLLVVKDPTIVPDKLTRKAFLLPLIAALLVVVFVGGFLAYRAKGNDLVAKGEVAYQANDYLGSFKDLYSANQLYRWSLNPAIPASEVRLQEVSVIVTADNMAEQKDYEAALAAVEKFHEFFPASEKTGYMNSLAVDQNLAWAQDLLVNENYQACLDQFQTILTDYPSQAAERKTDIDNAMAENYLAWGDSLNAEQSYVAGIEKLETVVSNYVNTTSYAPAYQSAAEAHYAYALDLASRDSFSTAEEHLLKVETDYINADVLEDAVNELPKLYLDWGTDLRESKSYLDAMIKLNKVAECTSDEDTLAKAENQKTEIIPLLARDEGEDGASVIQSALLQVCNGDTVSSLSVDIFPDEPGKAMACKGYTNTYVAEEAQADIPGTFRYAVTTEDADRRVQSCDYVTSMDSRVLERWQYGTKVTILNVKDGSTYKEKIFYGSSPESCPGSYWFSSKVEEEWGEFVDDDKIKEWVSTVIK